MYPSWTPNFGATGENLSKWPKIGFCPKFLENHTKKITPFRRLWAWNYQKKLKLPQFEKPPSYKSKKDSLHVSRFTLHRPVRLLRYFRVHRWWVRRLLRLERPYRPHVRKPDRLVPSVGPPKTRSRWTILGRFPRLLAAQGPESDRLEWTTLFWHCNWAEDPPRWDGIWNHDQTLQDGQKEFFSSRPRSRWKLTQQRKTPVHRIVLPMFWRIFFRDEINK